MIAYFKYSNNSCFLPYSREILLKLNICLIRGTNVTEQPFMTTLGILSSPTGLDGFSLLMALQSFASKIGTRDKNSEDCGRKIMSLGQLLL
jgi:hypothetical protein